LLKVDGKAAPMLKFSHLLQLVLSTFLLFTAHNPTYHH